MDHKAGGASIYIYIYIYVVQTTSVVRPFVPTKLLLFLSHSATLSVERLLNTKCAHMWRGSALLSRCGRRHQGRITSIAIPLLRCSSRLLF